jgi:hypothetical protein
MKKITVLASLFLLLLAAAAHAGAVLHLGSPPNTGTYLYANGTEVRPISSTDLGILENGNGQPPLIDPLLLIIGVPNVTSANFTAPAISLTTGSGTLGGTSSFSGAWNSTTGYAGNFTSAAGNNDVYSFIGLVPGGNNSNIFGNWAGADLFVNGITANGFGIFVYELLNTGITGGNTVDVTFLSNLNVGTFAVAYGQSIDKHGKITAFTTPFTEAGLTQNVPEPAAFMLFGVGLVSVWFMRRRFEK